MATLSRLHNDPVYCTGIAFGRRQDCTGCALSDVKDYSCVSQVADEFLAALAAWDTVDGTNAFTVDGMKAKPSNYSVQVHIAFY